LVIYYHLLKMTHTHLNHLRLGLSIFFVLLCISMPASALFNNAETASNDLKSFPKWSSVLKREPPSRAKKCSDGGCTKRNWHDHMQQLSIAPHTRQSLERVNDYFNKTPYLQDIQNWAQQDYWAIPLQFLIRHGDCEDYAIAKYMALRAQGWPAKMMRIVVLQDENLGILHSILSVKLKGKHYILDNQIRQVLTDRQIHHYRPIYSINELKWWRHYQS